MNVRTRDFVLLLALIGALAPTRALAQTATAEPALDFQIPPTDEGLPGAGPLHREQWFQNLWTSRRSKWAAQVDEDQQALVFLGDSITQGWGEDMGGNFPEVKVANRGIGGDMTRGILYRLDEDVLALNPTGIVMLIGTNDIGMNAAPEVCANNMKLILEKIKQHNPDMPVVLCSVMPSSEDNNRSAERIQKLNTLYADLVNGNPQVTFLDIWTLFANERGNAKPEEFPDLLHPNQQGYDKWAAALRPILATLGFLEQEPEEFTPEPGFESLFNGRDLTGWGLRPTSAEDLQSRANWRSSDPNAPPWPIITEPKSFDGQTSSDDGRFVARNGKLIVTTPTEGRKIQQLWTTREFSDDFILRLEFRATPNADSGVYLRGPQLQCRDYLLAGPYRELQHYKPQQWNLMEVTVRGNEAHSTCNGEVLEEAMQVPDSGPIGVEGDRGQMEYRRIRVKFLE